MSALKNISPGKKIPEDFNVIIEISAESNAVKYEMDKDSGLLAVDRFMTTAMQYPCNYGFVPNTLSQDGDPVDVLVITPLPIQAGALVRARAIGMLNMEDEAGVDTKILAVPIEKVCLQLAYIKQLSDVPKITLDRIVHFFEQYKALEPGKWVKITDWADAQAAAAELNGSIERYRAAATV